MAGIENPCGLGGERLCAVVGDHRFGGETPEDDLSPHRPHVLRGVESVTTYAILDGQNQTVGRVGMVDAVKHRKTIYHRIARMF